MKTTLQLLLAATLVAPCFAATHTIQNGALLVSLNTENGALSVSDQRTDQRFEQKPLAKGIAVTDASAKGHQITLRLNDPANGLELTGTIQLDAKLPEFTFELVGQGGLRTAVKYPHPFVSVPGQYLVIPMNEGISCYETRQQFLWNI